MKLQSLFNVVTALTNDFITCFYVCAGWAVRGEDSDVWILQNVVIALASCSLPDTEPAGRAGRGGATEAAGVGLGAPHGSWLGWGSVHHGYKELLYTVPNIITEKGQSYTHF